MAKRRSLRPGQPPPSVPDLDAEPGTYNEPAIERKRDAMPAGTLTRYGTTSLAELRLRIEQLLQRREAADTEAWLALGPEAAPLLLRLVDDAAIGRNVALRDRVIATLGQLAVRAAIPRLGQVLLDRAERGATRALAANAIGRIGDPTAIPYLVQAGRHADDVVRRQVAIALGRLPHPDAVPHLQALAADPSPAVSEAAGDALRQSQERLGVTLAPAVKPRRAVRPPRRKTSPQRERTR